MPTKKNETQAMVVDPSTMTLQTLQDTVQHALALGDAVAPEQARHCFGNTAAMSANVALTVASISGKKEQLKKEMPHLDLNQIFEMPHLIVALAILAREAEQSPADNHESVSLARKANSMRRMLMPILNLKVMQGVISAEKAAALPDGRNQVSRGGWLVDCARLIMANVSDLTNLVTAEFLDEAISVGMQLSSKGSVRLAMPRRRAANPMALSRDRVYTVLLGRYDLARRAGACLFGNNVDNYVPPLGSRRISHSATPAPVPAPAAIGGTPAKAA